MGYDGIWAIRYGIGHWVGWEQVGWVWGAVGCRSSRVCEGWMKKVGPVGIGKELGLMRRVDRVDHLCDDGGSGGVSWLEGWAGEGERAAVGVGGEL